MPLFLASSAEAGNTLIESELTGAVEFLMAVDPQRLLRLAALSSAVSLEANRRK